MNGAEKKQQSGVCTLSPGQRRKSQLPPWPSAQRRKKKRGEKNKKKRCILRKRNEKKSNLFLRSLYLGGFHAGSIDGGA